MFGAREPAGRLDLELSPDGTPVNPLTGDRLPALTALAWGFVDAIS